MKASELATILGGTLEGADVDIVACGGLEESRAGDLSFCKDTRHVALVQATKASAVLLPPSWDKGAPCSIIRVEDPNHACMAAAKLFAPPEPVRAAGIHPTAIPALFVSGVLISGVLMGQDLGTSMLMCAVMLTVIFVAGAGLRWFIFAGAGAFALFLALPVLSPVRWQRVTSFLEPEKFASDEGYQLWNSLMALGSGI